MRYLQLFAIILPIGLVLDLIWIVGIAMPFYQAELGSLLATDVIWPAAIAFYVFYIVALMVFVMKPAIVARSFKKAVLLGAFLGFTAYMTYDLTNLATTAGWSVAVAIVDIIWGTVFTAVLSGIAYLIATKWLKM
jgi:uncharacterized membrane protein